MKLHLALACSAMVVVTAAVPPMQPVVARAAEVDVQQPTPFTLYIQPSAPAYVAPVVRPASTTPSPTPIAVPTAAPLASGNRLGNAVLTRWKQPAPDGIHAASARVRASGVAQPQLAYYGGPVERAGSVNYSIFWKPAGYSMSPNYQNLINRYFQDIGGTQFYGLMSQYYDQGGAIVNSSSLGGTWADTTPYPNNTPSFQSNELTDTNIQESVLRAITANGWWPASGVNANFFVYTAAGEESCLNPSTCSTNYFCAYHSNFSTSHAGTTLDLKYANHPYDGNHLGGCGTPISPNSDLAADSEINSTSHEHFEMVTDPEYYPSAWLDTSMPPQEIGDKCLGVFGVDVNHAASVSLRGHPYIVQQEWSNVAADCAWSLPQASFDLTAQPSSGGTGTGSIGIAPLGLSCAAACAASFPVSAVVTLTATAAAGSQFGGWTGACTGTAACIVTMSAALAVSAIFDLTPCTPRPAVSVSMSGVGPGAYLATVASTGAGNALKSIQFGSSTNALIDVGSQTAQSGNFSVSLAAGTQGATFYVRRATPGAAMTVAMTITDSCGAWSTFVGAGANAP